MVRLPVTPTSRPDHPTPQGPGGHTSAAVPGGVPGRSLRSTAPSDHRRKQRSGSPHELVSGRRRSRLRGFPVTAPVTGELRRRSLSLCPGQVLLLVLQELLEHLLAEPADPAVNEEHVPALAVVLFTVMADDDLCRRVEGQPGHVLVADARGERPGRAAKPAGVAGKGAPGFPRFDDPPELFQALGEPAFVLGGVEGKLHATRVA